MQSRIVSRLECTGSSCNERVCKRVRHDYTCADSPFAIVTGRFTDRPKSNPSRLFSLAYEFCSSCLAPRRPNETSPHSLSRSLMPIIRVAARHGPRDKILIAGNTWKYPLVIFNADPDEAGSCFGIIQRGREF